MGFLSPRVKAENDRRQRIHQRIAPVLEPGDLLIEQRRQSLILFGKDVQPVPDLQVTVLQFLKKPFETIVDLHLVLSPLIRDFAALWPAESVHLLKTARLSG